MSDRTLRKLFYAALVVAIPLMLLGVVTVLFIVYALFFAPEAVL